MPIVLPNNIQNGQAIDAVPVMANFNALAAAIPSAGSPLAISAGGTGAGTVAAAMINLGFPLGTPEPCCQGRFNLITTTSLRLDPYKGNQIMINGVLRTIPSTGVTLAPTGLTTGMNNIFAFWNGSAIQLEANFTAWAKDTTTGMPIKSGDPSRTFLGRAFVQTGPVWDLANLLLTANYWNRLKRSLFNNWPTSAQTFTTTASAQAVASVVPGAANARIYVGSFGEDITETFGGGQIQGNNANIVYFHNHAFSIGNGTAEIGGATGYFQPYGAGAYGNMSMPPLAALLPDLGAGSGTAFYHQVDINTWSNSAGATVTYASAQQNVSIMG